nr:PQQ-binding-like beta-propeller repeat protein [Streptomyces roseifaciens]
MQPVQPAPPAPRRSRRKAVLAGAVAFLAAAAIGVAVALPQFTKGTDGKDSGAEAVSAASPGAAPARVVPPYGNGAHNGEFGRAARERSTRPAGWSPWNAKLPGGAGVCVLAGETLVCGGPQGGATALRAATGRTLWSVPALGKVPGARVDTPAVAGGTVYVPGSGGVTAVDLATGKEQWVLKAPSGTFLNGMEVSGGILYVVWFAAEDESGARIAAHRADTGHERLWQTTAGDVNGHPLVHDGRLYLSSASTVHAFDIRSGKEAARRPGLMCGFLLAHKDALFCALALHQGVTVLDARTLEQRKVIAPGTTVAAAPVVGDRNVLVVQGERELAGYDAGSGEQLWADPVQDGRPLLTGDRALIVTVDRVYAYGLDRGGQQGDGKSYSGHPWSSSGASIPPHALAAGQVVFLAYRDGTVLSGYAP